MHQLQVVVQLPKDAKLAFQKGLDFLWPIKCVFKGTIKVRTQFLRERDRRESTIGFSALCYMCILIHKKVKAVLIMAFLAPGLPLFLLLNAEQFATHKSINYNAQ